MVTQARQNAKRDGSLKNIKLHTEHVAKRRDVIRLTFRKGEPCSVQQREPADDCRQHRYYTAFGRICKYSIVTKIDEFFCVKTYEVEIRGYFDALFCLFFPWTSMSYIQKIEKNEKEKVFLKKHLTNEPMCGIILG